jgi:GT2 family glycosyltransferase
VKQGKDRDALVICTYKRFDDLQRCLKSLNVVGKQPEIIMVVDGDQDEVLRVFLETHYPSVTYVPSEKGLTIQRNVAIDLLVDARFVFFVDDDTEFLPGYFSRVTEIFLEKDVAGVGVTPLPTVKNNVKGLALLLGVNSKHPGTVRKNGLNVGRFEGEGFADWLPGCSMSFRVAAIGDIRFDERRSGYALGEDVDFGLRMRKSGSLYWFSEPLIVHHQSPVNRQKRSLSVRQSAKHKWTMADDHLGEVSKLWVIAGYFGEFFYWLILVIRWRSFEPLSYAFALTKGCWDVLTGGGLGGRSRKT